MDKSFPPSNISPSSPPADDTIPPSNTVSEDFPISENSETLGDTDTGAFVHVSPPDDSYHHAHFSPLEDAFLPVYRVPKLPQLPSNTSTRLQTQSHRIVSLPTQDPSITSKFNLAEPPSNMRVVSMPGRIKNGPVTLTTSLDENTKSGRSFDTVEVSDLSLYSDYSDASGLGLDKSQRVHITPHTTQSEAPGTPSPPSSPDSVVIIYNRSPQLSDAFLQESRCDSEGWVTWDRTSPKPIPALHGPLSLPYARCPSGAEGTLIEQPQDPSRVIWGLSSDNRPSQSSLSHTRAYSQVGRPYAVPYHRAMPTSPERLSHTYNLEHTQHPAAGLGFQNIVPAQQDVLPHSLRGSAFALPPHGTAPDSRSVYSRDTYFDPSGLRSPFGMYQNGMAPRFGDLDSHTILQQALATQLRNTSPAFSQNQMASQAALTPSNAQYSYLPQNNEIVLMQLRARAVPFVSTPRSTVPSPLPPIFLGPPSHFHRNSFGGSTHTSNRHLTPNGSPVIDLKPLYQFVPQAKQAPALSMLPTSTSSLWSSTFSPNPDTLRKAEPEPSIAHFSRLSSLLEFRRPSILREHQQPRAVSDPLVRPRRAAQTDIKGGLRSGSGLQYTIAQHDVPPRMRVSSFQDEIHLSNLVRAQPFLATPHTTVHPPASSAPASSRGASSPRKPSRTPISVTQHALEIGSVPSPAKPAPAPTPKAVDSIEPAAAPTRKPGLAFQAPRSVPLARLIQRRLPSVPEEDPADISTRSAAALHIRVSPPRTVFAGPPPVGSPKVLRARGPSVSDAKGFTGKVRQRGPRAPAVKVEPDLEMNVNAVKVEPELNVNAVKAVPTTPAPAPVPALAVVQPAPMPARRPGRASGKARNAARAGESAATKPVTEVPTKKRKIVAEASSGDIAPVAKGKGKENAATTNENGHGKKRQRTRRRKALATKTTQAEGASVAV